MTSTERALLDDNRDLRDCIKALQERIAELEEKLIKANKP